MQHFANCDYIKKMEDYKKRLARTLSETGALFFDQGLVLKDGRPTPYFVNMAMFNTGRLSLALGSFFASMMASRDLVKQTDIIVGPSYKGSAIALAASIALWQEHGIDLPFEYDRKEAKTHGEATGVGNMFVNRAFFDGCRVFVVDDVATSMGTKYELLQKIQDEADTRKIRIRVSGIGIVIDREQTTAVYDPEGKVMPGLKGKNAIQAFVNQSGVPVYRIAGIRETIHYLYQEQIPVRIRGKISPLDEATKTEFDDYIKIYGVD